MPDSARKPSKPEPARNTGRTYSFVPRALHKKTFLKWLRRTHAWCGLWGAMIALLFGVSGFVLNHRGGDLEIELANSIVTDLSVPVSGQKFNTIDELAAWLKNTYHVSAEESWADIEDEEQVVFENIITLQPASWSVGFYGPDKEIEARHIVGSNQVDVSVRNKNIWSFLNTLHKGNNLSVGWVLFADSIAGALIMLCLTGMLLWTKLHGTRILAVTLFVGAIVTATLTIVPGMVSFSL